MRHLHKKLIMLMRNLFVYINKIAKFKNVRCVQKMEKNVWNAMKDLIYKMEYANNKINQNIASS